MDAIPDGTHTVPVAPELIPPDYETGEPPFAVADIGVIYADSTDTERGLFTNSLSYGFYDGDLLFIGPHSAHVFFLANRTDTLAIKQPEAFAKSGYYPTNYAIEFDRYLSSVIRRDCENPGVTSRYR